MPSSAVARAISVCIAFSTGSLAALTAAAVVFLSSAPNINGIPASCATTIQQAAARSNFVPRNRTVPRFTEDSEFFMDGELPLPRPIEESQFSSAWRNCQVCPSGLRRANHVSPKRSLLFSRAPFANSAAETCLRPSSLTARTRKTVASPHQTKSSFFSKCRVPGPSAPAPLGKLALPSLDTTSPRTWQFCP